MSLYRSKRIYIRFVLAYMSFFLLVLLLTILLHYASIKVIEQYALDSAISLLSQSRDTVDFQLQQLSGIVDRFAEDYNVQAFLPVKKPLRDGDYNTLRNLYTKLPTADLNNSILYRLFVYFPNSDVLVSTITATSRVESLYGYYFKYEEASWEDLKEEVSSVTAYSTFWTPRSMSVEGTNVSAVTYIRSILSSHSVGIGGYVLALIKEEELVAKLDNQFIRDGGLSSIIDSKGKTIVGVDYGGFGAVELALPDSNQGSFRTEIGGVEMLVTHTASNVNDWRYVSVIPTRAVTEPVRAVTRTFVLVLLAAFIVWGIASLLMAGRNSRPISDITRLLIPEAEKQGVPPGNEFDFIRGTITRLISANESLTADMKQQKALVRNTFFERLLNNLFINKTEITHHMEHAGVVFMGDSFRVILVKIKGYYGQVTKEMLDEINKLRVLIISLMGERLGNSAHLHQVDDDTLAVILSKENIDFLSEISRIQDVFNKYRIIAAFGVGMQHECVNTIWKSYNEARKALEGKDGNLYLYEDIQQSGDEYSYPLQTESRLTTLVKLGESTAVEEMLETLHVDNFVKRKLTEERASLLIGEISGTITKLADESSEFAEDYRQELKAAVRGVMALNADEAAFREASQLLLNMSNYITKRQEMRRSGIKDEMLEYLQSHFEDPELCLYSVATRFGLAEKYFSHFFKEQTGENFSSCLEKIRMEKTRILLNDGMCPIAEIAAQVGYVNMNTFYKAFKRTFGVSPSNYKKCK